MAALPKKKISKVRGKTRRAHWHAVMPTLTTCAKCKTKKPAHTVCPECGYYGKAKVLNTKADKKIAQALKLEAKKTKKSDKANTPKSEQPTESAKPKTTKKVIQTPKGSGEEYQSDK